MDVEKKRSSRIALLILETYQKMIKGSLAALNAMSPQQLKRLYLNGEKKLNKSLRLSTEEQNTLKNLSQTNGYETCDFSLLYKLIRHFDLLETPINGWAKKVYGLNNIGDIVESLHKLRNSTIHRSKIAFEEHEEKTIFYKSLNIARNADRILNRTIETFEEEVDKLRSWDPEQKLRDKYIKALEKIIELRKLGDVRYLGYDIAIYMKCDWNSTPTDIDGRTPLTIYVKSDGIRDNAAASQHLNEMKDKINNKEYNIVFDSAETGSVIIHIVAKNSILLNEVIMVQEMRDFVERVFASVDEEFLKNFSHDIECIFASSDKMFDEEDCEFGDYDESWLKLHIDVASSIQKDPNQMKNILGQFVGDVFHATGSIHDSDTPIEVHVHSNGEERYVSSGGMTRKGSFSCTLDENAKQWKNIREDTIPGLTDLETDLRNAYTNIRRVRTGLYIATPLACGLLLIASPFTSGTSLLSAAGLMAGTLFVSVILIEQYLQRDILESVQKRVNKDKLATSKLHKIVDKYSEKDFEDLISGRQKIFLRKLKDRSPYSMEEFLEPPILSFIKKFITGEASSVLVAIQNVISIRDHLLNELVQVEELLEEFSKDDLADKPNVN